MKRSVTIMIWTVAVTAAASAVASTRAAPNAREAVPPKLVGVWGKTVTAATWRKYQIFYEPAGHWSIAVGKGGVTAIFMPPGIVSDPPLTTMQTSASGTAVMFGPTADGFCPGKARYRWKVFGRTLTLTALKDDCTARRVLLEEGAWLRK